MRVSSLLVFTITLALAPESGWSAPTEFPYEAVVEKDDVIVRSGPGERYDPTLKLSTGQQVTVHRHDPGGWYMISPPPGSFSWIDGAYVEKTGPETGIVKVPATAGGLPPRVVVWIGSQFTDEHKYFGRQLANGDEVRILGEKAGETERGATTFIKIAPPRLEYRWVKGDFIVSLSEAGRIARSTPVATPTVSADPRQLDPFANPLTGAGSIPSPGFPPDQAPKLLERDLTRGIGSAADRTPELSGTSATSVRSQLYELDDQLKSMLAQTPDHWDLTSMEQAYRQLQAGSTAGTAAQIDARLAAIESRETIKAEFDAFISVTQRTEQRDAALLSMQQSIAAGTPPGQTPVDLGQPTSFPQQLTNGTTQPTPTLPTQVSTPLTPPSGSAPQASVPQMDGAGIVRRLPRPQPGLPTHALTTPGGRHLTYLSAGQGVRLDDYIGKSMGVIGQRTHDNQLRSDVIVVERVTPVQLQP